MSLFVGNLDKDIDGNAFRELMLSYGPCSVIINQKYAFVDFQDRKHAEKAMHELDETDLKGLSKFDCNITWSKKYQSKEFFKAKDNESEQTKLSDTEEKETVEKQCFICKQKGHIAKKCPKKIKGTSNNTCYKCGQIGHLSMNCQFKQRRISKSMIKKKPDHIKRSAQKLRAKSLSEFNSKITSFYQDILSENRVFCNALQSLGMKFKRSIIEVGETKNKQKLQQTSFRIKNNEKISISKRKTIFMIQVFK